MSFSHIRLCACSLGSRNPWKLGQQAGSGLFKYKAPSFPCLARVTDGQTDRPLLLLVRPYFSLTPTQILLLHEAFLLPHARHTLDAGPAWSQRNSDMFVNYRPLQVIHSETSLRPSECGQTGCGHGQPPLSRPPPPSRVTLQTESLCTRALPQRTVSCAPSAPRLLISPRVLEGVTSPFTEISLVLRKG